MDNKLPDITLPVWMNKGEPLTLAHASKTWWERVREWLTFPLAQIDVDTCDEQLLALLAYQRDVERFPGESLSLFRLRVKYAFVNAQDAGCIAGFARIFERLEIGKIQQLERQLQYEWDVILIRINDEQLSRDNTLMMRLVRQYGRTCRRYFFDVMNESSAFVHSAHFDLLTEYDRARAPVLATAIHLSQNFIHILPGESTRVSYWLEPEDADYRNLEFKFTDTDVCSVEVDGEEIIFTGNGWGLVHVYVQPVGRDFGVWIVVSVGEKVALSVSVTDTSAPLLAIDGVDAESVYISVNGQQPNRLFTLVPTIDAELYYLSPHGMAAGENEVEVFGCPSLTFYNTSAPDLQSVVTKILSFCSARESMMQVFYGQKLLTNIESRAFNLPNAKVFEQTFMGCTSLKTLPDDFLIGCPKALNLRRTFMNCSSLQSLGDRFIGTSSPLDWYCAFYACKSLNDVPRELFGSSSENLNGALHGCEALGVDVDSLLPTDGYGNVTNVVVMFAYCRKLTGSGADFMKKIKDSASKTMAFRECTSLNDFDSLPEEWK